MIYVLRSAAFKEEGGFETIIKIGYTGEKSKKNRFSLYLTENPTIQTLFLINDGTERDEKNLHRHFKDYLVYGQEWFKDVDEIIEFFTNHKTKESLKELEEYKLNNHQSRKANINKKNFKNKFQSQITIASMVIGEGDTEKIKRIEKYLWYKFGEGIDNVIDEEFSEYKEEIINKTLEYKQEEKNNKSIKYFREEFNRDNNFVRRMKMLCDCYFSNNNFFVDHSKLLQTIIPREYQNYINLLGFERIKALKYQELDIKREVQSNQTIQSIPILSLFTVGSKYSKKQIKETLREFYEENNITKTPKATDLEEYFVLRKCQFIDKEIGKRVEGFEIINFKEKGI